jgi:Zn-dependent metalloprotease
MKKSITIVKALAFTLTVGFTPLTLLHAQDKNKDRTEVSVKDLPKISTSKSVGSFHANFDGHHVTSTYLIGHLGEWLRTNSDHTFQFVKMTTDEIGMKHSVYQHFYKGVKVADELILLHEKDGKITYVNGELSPEINLVIKQPLTQTEVEAIVNADMKAPDVTFAEFDQVITKVFTDKGTALHLASQINGLSLKNLRSYMYYVDNTTKAIVKKLEKIHNHNIPVPSNFSSVKPFTDTSSTSETYYKGNQQITVDSYNGAFRLKDNTRNIHTMNGADWDGGANVATGLSGPITEYTSSTANFTATDTKPPVEIHWAMKNAYDYYVNRHNRNSYDNNGSIIRNYYNINFNRNTTTGAGQAPENGVNAAAVDTQGIVAMVYGNGTYQGWQGYFYPFVAIDVAGHEYSHLMVSRTANLAYQGESGALNESFADMFGTAIEFYSGVTPNWTMGEGLVNPALGTTFLRSMSNPNSGLAALGSQQPDTYLGTYWASTTGTTDNGGVHTNSGVGNYWFYLLSMGGSGTNDSGTAFNVTGITIQKAEKIAYRALSTYLTANSQYADAYTASKQAAIDLYGAGSNEVQQVENAWCAVGLGNCANLLAVNETKSDLQNIVIYPNPVKNGTFTIENNKKEASFEIYDVSGKLVKQTEKLNKGTNKINISGIEKGVYILKINSQGSAISKKIIIE